MSGQSLVIRVAEQGADDERTDQVTRLLLRQLEDIDELDLRPVTAGSAPEGSRALDASVVGAFAASAADLAPLVGTIVTAVREWLRRSPEVPRSVRIEVGGDVLQLSSATAEQEKQLVDLFVARQAIVK
jgi:hypothetical protein